MDPELGTPWWLRRQVRMAILLTCLAATLAGLVATRTNLLSGDAMGARSCAVPIVIPQRRFVDRVHRARLRAILTSAAGRAGTRAFRVTTARSIEWIGRLATSAPIGPASAMVDTPGAAVAVSEFETREQALYAAAGIIWPCSPVPPTPLSHGLRAWHSSLITEHRFWQYNLFFARGRLAYTFATAVPASAPVARRLRALAEMTHLACALPHANCVSASRSGS